MKAKQISKFADVFRAERKRRGLTQAEAAEFLDVSPRSIWEWENEAAPHEFMQNGVIAKLRGDLSPWCEISDAMTPQELELLVDSAKLILEFAKRVGKSK